MKTQVIIAASSNCHWSDTIYGLNYSVLVDGRVIMDASAICHSLEQIVDSAAEDIKRLFREKNLLFGAEVIQGKVEESTKDGDAVYVLTPVPWYEILNLLKVQFGTLIQIA